MALPTLASVMRQRSVQVVQSRGSRAAHEAKRLAPWALPGIAAGEILKCLRLLRVA